MNPADASPACEQAARPAFCLLLILLCIFGTSAYAAPAHRLIVDPPPVLRTAEGFLVADISIAVDNEAGLRDLLKDGALLELEIQASVERLRSLLGNAELERQTRAFLLRHDPLSREFLLSAPGAHDAGDMRDRNLTRLLHAGWKKLTLPLVPLKTLRAEGEDEEFAVELRVTLRHADVPPWLQKNFVFWSSEVAPQLHFTLPFAFDAAADEPARP
jgi:hypothetical protein